MQFNGISSRVGIATFITVPGDTVVVERAGIRKNRQVSPGPHVGYGNGAMIVSTVGLRNEQGGQVRDGGMSVTADRKRSGRSYICPSTDQESTGGCNEDNKRVDADSIGNARVPENARQVETNVDLWIATVPEHNALHESIGLLSDEEIVRYRRLRVSTARARFINSHILLRRALSHAVDQSVTPSQWRYEKDSHGKPRVAAGLPQLHFNLSDEERVSAVAVSATHSVGVDVGTVAGNKSHHVVTAALSPHEQAIIESIPYETQFAGFVRLWVIKEAYAKMTGLGVALDLQDIKGPLSGDDDFTYFKKNMQGRNGAYIETHTIVLSDDRYYVALAVAHAGGKVETVLHLANHSGPDPKLRLAVDALSNSVMPHGLA